MRRVGGLSQIAFPQTVHFMADSAQGIRNASSKALPVGFGDVHFLRRPGTSRRERAHGRCYVNVVGNSCHWNCFRFTKSRWRPGCGRPKSEDARDLSDPQNREATRGRAGRDPATSWGSRHCRKESRDVLRESAMGICLGQKRPKRQGGHSRRPCETVLCLYPRARLLHGIIV
jgi:hypothetical protein